MRIGIIDADLIGRNKHRFPNLACMKISAYRKSLGDTVELVTDYDDVGTYDHLYLSKVFTDTDVPDAVMQLENLTYGGTGFYYDEAPPLAPEIEHIFPDYHLYDIWVNSRLENGGKRVDFKYYLDYSIGFMTRGCFRQCPFCVNRKYTKVFVHSPLDEFLDPSRPKICCLDDNFFGCSDWKRMLLLLKNSGKPFQFKQGLDERLLTDEKCELLFSSRYDGDFIFAFDNVDDYDLIESKLKLIRKHTDVIPKFYVFCGFDRADKWDVAFWRQDLRDLWKRIRLLMRYKCLPYIMRFNRYKESPYAGFYITVARWCNQPSFFKKLSFREFVIKDQGDNTKAVSSTRYMAQVEKDMPYTAKRYFDTKYTDEEVGHRDMSFFVYDVEVFLWNWLAIFKSRATGEYTIIHNDTDALIEFMREHADDVFIGFNSKSYDQYIIKGIAGGLDNAQIKELNDYIIKGNQGWQCPLLDRNFFRFNNVDIRDDMQKGLSLKAIEGHLGLSVQETTVSFDLDRPLTRGELDETIFYCKHDVDCTEKLVELRENYLINKVNIGRLAGLDDVRAMSMTNAKLTAALLKASAKPHDDERRYVYPPNLKREYIPQEVFAFFDLMYDESIPDEQLFKGKLSFSIGECPGVIGYGGIHAAIPNYFFEETGDRVIRNKDVASYYPHLMTLCGYTSRNIPSAKIFEDVLDTRMKAKASGDKNTANALKLVVNTTYGAMLNRYNDLFDPLMGRSVCISGQLFLLELAQHLYRDIRGLKIVQLNTDGIMVECNRSDLGKLDEICDEWQKRTGFELEEDAVAKIAQKDVNNYVEVQPSGKAKAKGGYLVKGVAPAGAFNINNSCCIVATALKEYFVNGTPVEDTINGCEDIFQFQIVAKAGAKYKEAYHVVNGEKESVQKVNRVYATADTRYGKIFKVKTEDESEAKIEMLPEHCIIDNDNQLTISDVDKTFYIEMARKRINDFLGVKPEKKGRKKKMTASTKQNIYKRLAIVREKFLAGGIKKTGKNTQLKSMYFQLEDIVPISTPLFHEQDLLPVTNFTKDECTLTVIDMTDSESRLVFTAPMREWLGNAAVTPVQALGATITYMRRYLYQMALDVVEVDEMESGATPTSAPASPAPKAPPATPETREEVKKQLTNAEGNATPLQIKQLKSALKKLIEVDPTKEEMVAQIAIQTQSFENISKTDCEQILSRVSELIAQQTGDA